MTLSISILGPLVIESGDCRFGKVPKKARALLAFLAAQLGQPVSRERLADLLWPYQGAERDRILALVCDVLHRLSAQQDAAGEHEAAIQSGRRLVSLDALSEFGQRALMRAYARAGRRGEALRQYKSCAETLKRELGVAP